MPDPEQVIEVPKILPEDVSVRTVVREPQLAEQLVEVPTLVSLSLPVDAPAMPLAARGSSYLDRAVIAGGGCRVRATPSGTPRRGAPPGQGGVEIVARMIVDVPSTMQLLSSSPLQFLDRVPDIPVVPQKGDSTVQSLNKVVDAGCARQLPMAQTVKQLRSPTRSTTSLFSRSEAEVPQIQSFGLAREG